jgi:hypothetical protein
VEKRNFFHCHKSNLGRPSHSPSLYRLTNPDSFIQGVHGSNLGMLTSKQGFSVFSSSFLIEGGIVPLNGPQPLPYKPYVLLIHLPALLVSYEIQLKHNY